MNYRELGKTGLEVFVFVVRASYSSIKNSNLGRLIEFFEYFRRLLRRPRATLHLKGAST